MIAMHGTLETRSGVTLTEVLVAIFIMGIGLLSLLVLFPVGALNMVAASKDERTADTARNALSIARTLNIRDDDYVFGYYTNVDYSPTNANYPFPPTTLPLPAAGGASYPVYVDPQGVLSGSDWMGYLASAPSPGFRRVAPKTMYTPPFYTVVSSQLAARWTSVGDDMNFDTDGKVKLNPPIPPAPSLPVVPYPPLAQQVQREPRYSFAFLCRQVRAYSTNGPYDVMTPPAPYFRAGPPAVSGAPAPFNTPSNHLVDLTVVVYDRRPNIALPVAPGVNIPVEEKAFSANFGTNMVGVAAPNMVVLSWPAGTPPPVVRRGTWILDATVVTSATVPEPHGYFYRVANITQVSTTMMELQLQKNVQNFVGSNPSASFTGVAVVMDNVAEVFEKFTN